MIRLSTVQKLKVEIGKSAQSAHKADGSSPLKVIGETKLSFTHGQHVFQFDRLVVENLDVEVLAGTPFMEANDITVHPAKCLITLQDGSSFTYGSSDDRSTQQVACRAVWSYALPQLQPHYGMEITGCPKSSFLYFISL